VAAAHGPALAGPVSGGPKLGPLPTLWLHGEEDQLVPLSETRVGIEALGVTA
jgi:predicted esterase